MSKTPNSDSARVTRSTASAGEAPILTSIDQNKSITLADLRLALDGFRKTLREEIRNDFRQEISELKEKIQKQSETIDILKNTVIHQATVIEKIENKNCSNFAIIHGIPESTGPNENLNDIVKKIIHKTNVDIESSDVSPIRIGKRGKAPRPVKIKFKSEKIKKEVVDKARTELPKDPETKHIYLNYDQGLLTRKENARLRAKLKNLRTAYPDKETKIFKGHLLVNGVSVDSFHLKNQVFQ